MHIKEYPHCILHNYYLSDPHCRQFHIYRILPHYYQRYHIFHIHTRRDVLQQLQNIHKIHHVHADNLRSFQRSRFLRCTDVYMHLPPFLLLVQAVSHRCNNQLYVHEYILLLNNSSFPYAHDYRGAQYPPPGRYPQSALCSG